MPDQDDEVVRSLEILLANTYVVYLKTHGYHWNVTGPMFTSLHTLFETQYTELAIAVDALAERLRALDAPAPGSYSQFAAVASIAEDSGRPSATEMLENLVDDQRSVVESARALVRAAENEGDDASADLGVSRITVHEQSAWMLRSHLG